MRAIMSVLNRALFGLVFAASVCLPNIQRAFAAGADYDGNGFSEIPVLVPNLKGQYTWILFDPASGKQSVFTDKFGTPGEGVILANWIYPQVTSAGILSAPNQSSAGRLVWRIRTAVRSTRKGRASRNRRGGLVIREQTKYLGRRGDRILTGGDFDGDRVGDAVVITNRGGGMHTWGLRGSFFLAGYNPGLNINRAYFSFGALGEDEPFYLNPDGLQDWFAVMRRAGSGSYQISFTQPFTRETRALSITGALDSDNVPVPLGQEDGRDLLVFSKSSGGETYIEVRDLSGKKIAETRVPISGEVTVGNYGAGPGEEIAVSGSGSFFVFNPITERLISMSGPAGFAVDSVNIQAVE